MEPIDNLRQQVRFITYMISSYQSEQINPWTVRQKKTPLPVSKQKPAEVSSHQYSLPLRQAHKTLHPKKSDLSIQKFLELPMLRTKLRLRGQQLASDERIQQLDKMLNQDFYSKFLPNYKLVNISFENKSTNRNKNKKPVPYNIQSLRQYTDNEVNRKKDVNKKGTKGSQTKIVRYHSQERENDDEKIIKVSQLQSQSAWDKKHLARAVECKNYPTIKLINRSKTEQTAEKISSQKQLYNKLDSLCDIRGTLGHKLSLMKRTYNMKKIKKILT